MVPRASSSPTAPPLPRSPLTPLPPRWERLWLEDATVLIELSPLDHGAEVQGSEPKPRLQTPPRSRGPRSGTSQGDAGRGRPLTRIRQSRAHQAQQLPLLLVVALTEELPLLQHKLVALLQAPLADAAAEAAQVVDALLGTHHQLAGCDGLQAPGALHREEPGGVRGDPAGTPGSTAAAPGGWCGVGDKGWGTRGGQTGIGTGSLRHPVGALIVLRGWAPGCWHPAATRHALQACPLPMADAAFGSTLAFLVDLLPGAYHECSQRTETQRPDAPGEKQTGVKPNSPATTTTRHGTPHIYMSIIRPTLHCSPVSGSHPDVRRCWRQQWEPANSSMSLNKHLQKASAQSVTPKPPRPSGLGQRNSPVSACKHIRHV